MGNIFSETSSKNLHSDSLYISFHYEGQTHPIIKVNRVTYTRHAITEFYILSKDILSSNMHKMNMTIWRLNDHESKIDFKNYIKILFDKLTEGHVLPITIQTNIGYPETTFEFNNKEEIFKLFDTLFNVMTKIEVAKSNVFL
jgi:hypothetical protein